MILPTFESASFVGRESRDLYWYLPFGPVTIHGVTKHDTGELSRTGLLVLTGEGHGFAIDNITCVA